MRPIELTISAFGPYAGTTTPRFDALGTQRLFVITGPTGSGRAIRAVSTGIPSTTHSRSAVNVSVSKLSAADFTAQPPFLMLPYSMRRSCGRCGERGKI